MDRYLLRYFLAVAEAGHFSKAAAKVGVTQPTLSVGIAKLEAELGARLFERTTRRVSLTPAGARFLEHAKKIAHEYEVALREVSDAPKAGRVRAGVLGTVFSEDLDRIIAAHARGGTGEPLELLDGSERDLANRLTDGRIDIALTILRPGLERFAQEKLRRESYMVAMAAHHPLAGSAGVDGGQLSGETMIVRRQCEALAEISRYFTGRDVRPSFSFKTTSDDRAMRMVRAGLGVTVVPSSFRMEGVKLVKLRGFTITRDIGLVYSDRVRELGASAAAFVNAVKASYPSSRAKKSAAGADSARERR